MKTYIYKSFNRRRLNLASLAAASAVTLLLGGCEGSSSRSFADPPTIIEANIDTLATQIGGATQDVKLYNDGTMDWTIYTMANRLAVTPVGMSKGTVTEITVPGYIQRVTVVKDYGGKSYALLSMGGKGIGVVDITAPATMTYLRTMSVGYTAPAYTSVDGGGTEFSMPETVHASGPVNDLLVDNRNTPETSDDELYIANPAFGIQKTRLSNLMDATADGAVSIDLPAVQAYTLKYASENPWGGPLSLKLYDGKLYAALGFLGMGIYNPDTLVREGAYNLYADCGNTAQEDWFGYPNLKISCPGTNAVAVAGGVDADGMPSYLQAKAELKNKNVDGMQNYPWASFDRYGKYYYNARTMDVQVIGARTMAFIAYSLGGLVAVDVTNPAAPEYAGYVPAAPAHGPDEPPIHAEKRGILSHFGSGMLKEAGVMDVRVVPNTSGGYKAYYTDHFAGLVVANGAEDPANRWRNGQFNNDTDTKTFWPDYEFVTSYDMTPVPVGDESMPKFLVPDASGNYTGPVMLVTGEINGHGGALFLMPSGNHAAAGQVDAVQSSGGGGVSFIDFIDLEGAGVPVASRFSVPVNLVSTNEVGALESGAPGQQIAIGHGEGVTVSGNFLYLADGPHGVSVWRIANGLTPIDELHLVANTLQDEYPTPGGTVMPTPHAFKVAFGSDSNNAYVMSQSLGIRRINVSSVTSGSAQVGAPALLNAAGGIFEHNTEAGNVGLVQITGQDHAYGTAFYGKYAIVADGDNGLTVYDTTAVAGSAASVVGNIGDAEGTTGKPPLGRAASVKLWTNPATNHKYAVVAAGAFGISVVDMTAFLDSGSPLNVARDLIKTFEPLKSDDDNPFGSADGKSVDVHVVGDIAYFSYDSFGLVAYRMADLIQPVVRPTAVGYFKLQKQAGFETLDGGALYMTPQFFPALYRDASGQMKFGQPRLLFYVAYGDAGVVKLDWSDVANPRLMAIKEVVGSATATAINNGRVYVAAGSGGLTVLK